jgi:hypothetical protein
MKTSALVEGGENCDVSVTDDDRWHFVLKLVQGEVFKNLPFHQYNKTSCLE